jgi:hypothetical protein
MIMTPIPLFFTKPFNPNPSDPGHHTLGLSHRRQPSSARPGPTHRPPRGPPQVGSRDFRPVDLPHLHLSPPPRQHLHRPGVPRKALRQNHPPRRPQPARQSPRRRRQHQLLRLLPRDRRTPAHSAHRRNRYLSPGKGPYGISPKTLWIGPDAAKVTSRTISTASSGVTSPRPMSRD